jgi:magnesium transporter
LSLEYELAVAFLESHPTEAAVALERMRGERRAATLAAVPAAAAVPAVRAMVRPVAADCLARLDAAAAGDILEGLDVDAAAAVLRRIPPSARARLIDVLRYRAARGPRAPAAVSGRHGRRADGSHGPDTPDDVSIAEARVRLRRTVQGLLFYLYVVDRDQRLVGVLDVAELMGARAGEPLRSVMHTPVERLPAWLPAAAVRTDGGWKTYHAMPVVDEADRFLGAIRYQALRRLEHEADAAGSERPTAATVAALGELFHLGMAGFVEGISAAAVPRGRAATVTDASEGSEARHD